MPEPSSPARRARWELIILVTVYGSYAAMMLCRNTLGAASAAMILDPSLGLDKASYGQLMAYHSAGAILGKLVTGIAADKLGGRPRISASPLPLHR